MANLQAWSGVLGPAIATAAEGYLDATDELSDTNVKRRRAAAERDVLPLETAVRQQELSLQLQSGQKRVKSVSHDTQGNWVIVYDDGTMERKAFGDASGSPVKDTAYMRKLKGIVYLMENGSDLEKQLATGEFKRLTQSQDPKLLQALKGHFQREAAGLPPDPATQLYLEGTLKRQGIQLPSAVEPGTMPTAEAARQTGEETRSSAEGPSSSATTEPPAPPATPSVQSQEGGYRPTSRGTIKGVDDRRIEAYRDYFARLGPEQAKAAMEGFVRADPQGKSPQTQARRMGYELAFPSAPTGLTKTAQAQPLQAPSPVVPAMPSQPATLAPQGHETPKARAEEVATQRHALGLPTYKPDEVAKAQELFPWIGNPPDLQRLTPEQMNVIHELLAAEKETTGFHRVLRQAAPQLAELASMDSTQAMADEVRSLLGPETVGLRGRYNRLVQGYLPQIPGMSPEMIAQHRDARIPRLEAASHAIGYIHANAIKRIGAAGGPGQRGSTAYDVKEVTGWFDPFAPSANLYDLEDKLTELGRVVRVAKPIVEKELRALGVDPVTHGPLKGHAYGGEVAPTEPAVIPDDDAAVLRGGR